MMKRVRGVSDLIYYIEIIAVGNRSSCGWVYGAGSPAGVPVFIFAVGDVCDAVDLEVGGLSDICVHSYAEGRAFLGYYGGGVNPDRKIFGGNRDIVVLETVFNQVRYIFI
jgi:hypothetical protein